MTDYSATIGAHRKTLTANTADRVTFASDLPRVDIVNHDASSDLYATVDGSTPAVIGAGSYQIPAGGVLNVAVPTQGPTKVRLIAASAVTYSVQAGA